MFELKRTDLKTKILFTVVIAGAAAYLYFVSLGSLEPENEFQISVRKMGEIRSECVAFKTYTGRYPASPADLKFLFQTSSGKLRDGWGLVLDFQTNSSGGLTITSFGADGKLGGTGNAGDIFMTLDP